MWLFWTPFVNRFEFASNVGEQATAMVHILIDSKAMRKIEDGDALVAIAELGTGVGAGVGVAGILLTRWLFMTH